MRTSTISAFVAAMVAVSGAVAVADTLNPQPLPPGRHATTQPAANHAQEPPDPCMQSHGTGGGTGKIQNEMMMRKAGGSQMGTANTNVHCLNPQPLPPG